MIHTVTLNPTLDITYLIDRMSFGEPVSAIETSKTPGGKGINVSRALRNLGVDSVAITLIGGYIGEEVLYLLEKEGLILQVARILNETRATIIIFAKEDEKELMIRSAGPPVKETETQAVCNYILELARWPEILVLSGSIPPGIDSDVYRMLIERGQSQDTKVILDTSGEPFREGIKAGPYLIKPNRVELEELAGRELPDDESIIDFCRELNQDGISIVLVSLGSNGAILVSEDEVLRGLVPRVQGDPVGAGDSTVAGFVLGISQEEDLQTCFRMGLACGVSSVMQRGPGLCEPDNVKAAIPEVEIEIIH